MLLRAADQICAELGYREVGEPPGTRSEMEMEHGALRPDDEALVAQIRAALARIADAVGPGGSRRAINAALDGTEVVVRGQLRSGTIDQLAALMPSFVFLVAMPSVEPGRAIELAERTAELIAASE